MTSLFPQYSNIEDIHLKREHCIAYSIVSMDIYLATKEQPTTKIVKTTTPQNVSVNAKPPKAGVSWIPQTLATAHFVSSSTVSRFFTFVFIPSLLYLCENPLWMIPERWTLKP